MFKTKKSRRNAIITIIAIAACLITFCITKIAVRGDMSASSGGEVFIFFIPLIVYLFIKNWKLFKETCKKSSASIGGEMNCTSAVEGKIP